MRTYQVDQHELNVNKKPFGFIPEIISSIINVVKGQDIEFCNPCHWLHDMHELVKTNKPNYQEACVTIPSGLQVSACDNLL